MSEKFKRYLMLGLFLATMLTSLWPDNIYLLCVFSVTCWIFLPSNKWWDGICRSLFVFSVLYGLMEILNGKSQSGFILISHFISPVAFYRFGRWLLWLFNDETVRFKMLFAATLCYLTPLFIMTAQDMAVTGFINESRIVLYDVINGTTMAATLYGLMASVGIGCIAVLFTKQTSLLEKISFLIISILSLLTTVHLVNRTGLVILVSCILFSFAYTTRFKLSRMFFSIIVVLLLLCIIYNTGLISDEVVEAYINRESDSVTDSKELGGRTVFLLSNLSSLFSSPFGWESDHYAHNLWIDLAKIGGWGSLFAFLVATKNIIKNFFKIACMEYNSFRAVTLSIMLAMFFNASVEPVIEGSMLYFSIFMMFWGILKAEIFECKK